MLQNPVLVAALWMGGCLASFSLMAVGGRELAGEINLFQVLTIRSALGLVIVSLLLSRSGWGQIKTRRPDLFLLRNLVHFGAQYSWFYGIALLPLAQVFAIEFTQPIWVPLIAALFLGEKITKLRIMVVAIGFIGILIILRPGWEIIHPASFVVLLSAWGFAISLVITKAQMSRGESALAVLFYMCLLQLPMGLIPAWPHWITPSETQWVWLVVIGLGALSAHYCLARALAEADATVVIPLDFLRLPLIALVGFLVYQESLDPMVLLGAVIVAGGNYLNVRAGRTPASSAGQGGPS